VGDIINMKAGKTVHRAKSAKVAKVETKIMKTPEQQRIAIALYCGAQFQTNGSGWTFVTFGNVWPEIAAPVDPEKVIISNSVPDYLNDLNAMQEAWACLGWEEKNECIQFLICIVKDADAEVYFANASQRAEAFLRTIKLWEEALPC